ncbi:MAG: hypothetical protein Kow00129_13050 [Thermoleophilia bacterium]
MERDPKEDSTPDPREPARAEDLEAPNETPPAFGSSRDETEVPDHYRQRLGELEPDLGRRGRWGYLFWVILWLVVLVAAAVIYGIAGRPL